MAPSKTQQAGYTYHLHFLRARQILRATALPNAPPWTKPILTSDIAAAKRYAVLTASDGWRRYCQRLDAAAHALNGSSQGNKSESQQQQGVASCYDGATSDEEPWPPNWESKARSLSTALVAFRGWAKNELPMLEQSIRNENEHLQRAAAAADAAAADAAAAAIISQKKRDGKKPAVQNQQPTTSARQDNDNGSDETAAAMTAQHALLATPGPAAWMRSALGQVRNLGPALPSRPGSPSERHHSQYEYGDENLFPHMDDPTDGRVLGSGSGSGGVNNRVPDVSQPDEASAAREREQERERQHQADKRLLTKVIREMKLKEASEKQARERQHQADKRLLSEAIQEMKLSARREKREESR